jgi:hypothetical protein
MHFFLNFLITGLTHYKSNIQGWIRWLTPEISATQEAEIGRITIQGQPMPSVSKTPISTKKLGVVEHALHPGHAGGVNRKIVEPGQNARPYPKNN